MLKHGFLGGHGAAKGMRTGACAGVVECAGALATPRHGARPIPPPTARASLSERGTAWMNDSGGGDRIPETPDGDGDGDTDPDEQEG